MKNGKLVAYRLDGKRAGPDQVRTGGRAGGVPMSSVSEALRLPLSEDLSGFIALLRRLRVPCRVSEEGDQQVLRVPSEVVEQVRDLYARYPGRRQRGGRTAPAARRLRRCPACQPAHRGGAADHPAVAGSPCSARTLPRSAG